MTIQESAEMYLKTIYILSLEHEHVRSIDISRQMHYSKPSITRAMKNLSSEDYITIDDNGYITLTVKGDQIARKIYERHEVLYKLFIRIGIDPRTAYDDACKIEHVISDETFAAIRKLNKGSVQKDQSGD